MREIFWGCVEHHSKLNAFCPSTNASSKICPFPPALLDLVQGSEPDEQFQVVRDHELCTSAKGQTITDPMLQWASTQFSARMMARWSMMQT
jgi:hypothetical protein